MRGKWLCSISVILLFMIFVFTGCNGKKENPIKDQEQMANQVEIQKAKDEPKSDEPKNNTILYVVNGVVQQFRLEFKGNLTPQILLAGLADTLKVNIDVNYAEVKDDRINIDFNPTSSPISAPPDAEESQFVDDNTYVYTVLDSIKMTLNKNLGENKAIYYSVNGNACLFKNTTPPLRITPKEPYLGNQTNSNTH